jgi:uncharacterized protein YjiS (DUF1127 family)
MNSYFRSLISWFAKRQRRRRELGELSQMNDHLLKDIGLTKMDVRRFLKTGIFPERVYPGERKRTD